MTDQTADYTEEHDIVLYEAADGIAWITMNRPKYNNAQNGRMTYELDDAFKRAVADDDVKVISRAQVRVLSAQEKDKVLVNTNEFF